MAQLTTMNAYVTKDGQEHYAIPQQVVEQTIKQAAEPMNIRQVIPVHQVETP